MGYCPWGCSIKHNGATSTFTFFFFLQRNSKASVLILGVKLNTRAGVLCVFLQPLFMGKDSKVTKQVKEDL